MIKTFFRPALAVTGAIFLCANMASAKIWGHNKNGMESANVTIINDANLGNGPEIKAGTYKLELVKESPNPELAFYQYGKLVLQTEARLVNENKKIDTTEVTYDTSNKNNQVIQEISPQGWDQKVVFENAGQSPSSGSSPSSN